MIILPAIDLYEGRAVRLFKGDYSQMTVYSDRPELVALDFKVAGAEWIHVVDLQGAKDGTTPNLGTVKKIIDATSLSVEIGGGIRTMEALDRYFEVGAARAILGTGAISDKKFLRAAVEKYGQRIAVGADIKDGYIAIKGWVERTDTDVDSFFTEMQSIGVGTVICTDISRDGAMKGTNLEMYRRLSEKYRLKIGRAHV